MLSLVEVYVVLGSGFSTTILKQGLIQYKEYVLSGVSELNTLLPHLKIFIGNVLKEGDMEAAHITVGCN